MRQFRALVLRPFRSDLNEWAAHGWCGPRPGALATVGLFVRQGVEAALAEFDAQVSFVGNPGAQIASSTDRPQNVNTAFTGFPQVLDLRTGGATAQIQKKAASGTQFIARSTTDYDRGNQRGNFQALNSIWTQALEVEVRHPLLRGGGVHGRAPMPLSPRGAECLSR